MLAAQVGYGMSVAEEVVDNVQYNAPVTQFATEHASAQGSTANLTATNAVQQQHIAALQLQVTQSANNVGQVMYCPPPV